MQLRIDIPSIGVVFVISYIHMEKILVMSVSSMDSGGSRIRTLISRVGAGYASHYTNPPSFK